MKKDIQVLLLEDIDGVGEAGAIVSVSEGYARNSLFPEGKAALATDSVQKKNNEEQKKKTAKEEKEMQKLQEIAEKLDGTELRMEAKVKDGTDIFGSITVKQIAEELSKAASIKVAAGDMDVKEPIKAIGSYPIVVTLADEVEFTTQLVVEPDAESREKEEDES